MKRVFFFVCLLLVFHKSLQFIWTNDEEDPNSLNFTSIEIKYLKEKSKVPINEYNWLDNSLIKDYRDMADQIDWHAIGSPLLLHLSPQTSSISLSNLFRQTQSGFSVYLDAMTRTQKQAISDKLKERSGVNVSSIQIITYRLSELACEVEVNCGKSKSNKIVGQANSFAQYPLEVQFKANQATRACLTEHLSKYQELKINCSFVFNKTKKFSTNAFLRISFRQETKKNLSSKSDSSRIYHQTFEMKQDLIGYNITESFNSVWVAQDMSDCWEQCTKEAECVAVSYNHTNRLCFRFNISQFQQESVFELQTSSTKSREIRAVQSATRQRTRLVGYFLSIDETTSDSCWQKCNEVSECVAVSFKHPKCYLFKHGQYLVERDNDWQTLHRHDTKIDAEYSKAYDTTSGMGHFEIVDSASVYFCWRECGKKKGCVAATYDDFRKECLLHKKDQYRVESYTNRTLVTLESETVNGSYSLGYVNILLANHFKQIKSKNEFECWKKCLAEGRKCVGISYLNGNCNLNEKNKYRVERGDYWLTIVSKDESISKTNYTERYENTIIKGGSKSTKRDENSCWLECQQTVECKAVTFYNQMCYLHKSAKDANRIEKQNGSITIAYANIGHKRYIHTKLSGNFSLASNVSEFACWRKCVRDAGCVAVSHKKTQCLMYKNSSVSHKIHELGWSTLAYEHQRYDKVVYNRTQIHGFFMQMPATNASECWSKCLSRAECIAISFGKGLCQLTKRGEYQTGQYNNWITIYKDGEHPPELSDNASFTLLKSEKPNSEWVLSLAILHSGDLVTGGEDSSIRIWNRQNISLRHEMTGHSRGVSTLLVLHNGNLVSGSWDQTIIIWNGTRLEKNITSHEMHVYHLALLSNTDFASAAGDNTIKIWSFKGDLKRTIKEPNVNFPFSFIELPDGNLAGGQCDGIINIWNENGNFIKNLAGHRKCVSSLVALDNGYLASSSVDDYSFKIWDESGKLMHTFSTDYFLYALAVLPNGDLIYPNGYLNYKIEIKSLGQVLSGSEEIKQSLGGHEASPLRFMVYSNGDFVSCAKDGSFKYWKH